MFNVKKKSLFFVISATLLLISCRVLSGRQAEMSEQELQTSVDQTVAAMDTDQDQAELTVQPDPIEPVDPDETDLEIDQNNNDIVMVTETQEPIGPMAVTDEACEPTVQVSVSTNCRVGPGQEYARVTALSVGQTARVIGRNAEGTYWIIQPPGSSGHCWLWGRYATVTCATAGLAIYEPPPTATPRQATATRTSTATRTPTVTQTPYDGGEIYFSCTRLLTLSPNSYVSLANCQRLSGSGGDLLYTTGLELRPLSGTRFGIWGSSNPEFLDCANHAGLNAWAFHRDSLAVGTRVCFWTGENRIGFFEVLAKDSPVTGNIQIHVRTWMTYR